MFPTLKITFIVLLVLCTMFPRPAYAYLDPGTGSYIMQIIIATLIGASVAIKLFWRNIKTFLKNLFSEGKRSEKNEHQ